MCITAMLHISCDAFVGSVRLLAVSFLSKCVRIYINILLDRRIRFVSCSATIANPLRHMKNIFGIDVCPACLYSTEGVTHLSTQNVQVITDDGAPSGRKDFLIWNPSLKDPMDPSLGRHSAISESTKIMRFLMKKGVRTILFCKV